MAWGKRIFLTIIVLICAFLMDSSLTMGAILEKGWHLLSSRCELNIASLTLTNVASVWKWENGNWAVYLPSGDTSTYASQKNFNVLNKISPGEGFWVNASGLSEIPNCNSSMVEDGILSLSKEWNLKGVRSSNKVYVDQLFDNPSLFKSVWSWSNSKQNWKVFLPAQDTSAYASQKGFEILNEIEPDEGFWVNSNSSVILDTSEAFLKEEDTPKVLGNTYLVLNSSSSISGSSLEINDSVNDYSGLSKSTFNISWNGSIGPLLDWVFQNYTGGVGGLYASTTMGVPCDKGGTLDVQANWDGPQQPYSVYDISNLKMTINAYSCKFDNVSIDGKISYYIPGIYGYATSAQVTMENVTIVSLVGNETVNIFTPKVQINYSDISYGYSGLSFKSNLNGDIVAKLGNGKSMLLKYNNFKMTFAMNNSGSGQISFEGKVLSDNTNGWITMSTKIPFSFNSYGNILNGTAQISFRSNNIMVDITNGVYYVYFNGKYLGTYTENDLKNTLK